MSDEDFSNLPLADRLIHKVWKVRQDAYKELEQLFLKSSSESDECFHLVDTNMLNKMVVESNVAAQENGIAAVLAYLQYSGANSAIKARSHIVTGLVEKGMTSNRAGTRQKSLDCLICLTEHGTMDPVIEQIIPAFLIAGKLPKLIVAATVTIREIYTAFGATPLNAKPTVSKLAFLFGHADKNVRAETFKLAVELYRWVGAGFYKAIEKDLKPVQQKELQDQFSQYDNQPKPQPTKYNRPDREAMELAAANAANGMDVDDENSTNTNANGNGNGDGNAHGSGNGEDYDDDQFIDPVSVRAKIAPKLMSDIASTKWKERKEALELLVPILNVPKINVDEDLSDVVGPLAKCIAKDANVQCVGLAATCVEYIARGLRRSFRYEQPLLSPLLDRTKEKKILSQLEAALDTIFKSCGYVLSSVLEPTVEHMAHKTPQIRIESCKFLIRCLKTTPIMPNPPDIKICVQAGLKLLNDTQEPARACGQEVLGTIMKMTGERPFNQWLEGVDDIKKAKINQFFKEAQVSAKAEPPKPTNTNNNSRPAVNGSAAALASSGGIKRTALKQPLKSTPAKPPPANRRRLVSPVKPMQPMQSLASATSSSSSASASSTSSAKPWMQQPMPNPHSTPQQSYQQEYQPTRTPEHRGSQMFDEDAHMHDLTASAKSMSLDTNNAKKQQLNPGLGISTANAGPDDRRLTSRVLRVDKPNESTDLLRAQNAELAKEKESLLQRLEEETNEKSRLAHELSEARRVITEHIDAKTAITLESRSKDTQLTRALSDLEMLRIRNSKLEAEVERLRKTQFMCKKCESSELDNENIVSPTSNRASGDFSFRDPKPSASSSSGLRSFNMGKTPGSPTSKRSPPGKSMTLQFGLDTRKTHNMRRSQDIDNVVSPSETKRMSFVKPSLNDEPGADDYSAATEHRNDSLSTSSSSSTVTNVIETRQTNMNSNINQEWKRAAAVTNDLKERIAAMKRARAAV